MVENGEELELRGDQAGLLKTRDLISEVKILDLTVNAQLVGDGNLFSINGFITDLQLQTNWQIKNSLLDNEFTLVYLDPQASVKTLQLTDIKVIDNTKINDAQIFKLFGNIQESIVIS